MRSRTRRAFLDYACPGRDAADARVNSLASRRWPYQEFFNGSTHAVGSSRLHQGHALAPRSGRRGLAAVLALLRGIFSGCRASAASGQTAPAPLMRVMKSRRLIGSPRARTSPGTSSYLSHVSGVVHHRKTVARCLFRVKLGPSGVSAYVCLDADSVAKLGKRRLTRNNRIGAKDFLNRCCALVAVLESMLPARAPKIVLPQYDVAVVRERDLRAPSYRSGQSQHVGREPRGLRQLWIHAAAFAASNQDRIVARCIGFLIIA